MALIKVTTTSPWEPCKFVGKTSLAISSGGFPMEAYWRILDYIIISQFNIREGVNMKKCLILAGISLLVPSLCFAASLNSMKKAEVTKAIADKTFTTISAATLNDKVIKNSFTGYFSKDGKASGSFEMKPDNDPQSDTGTWNVNSDGKLCYKWDHWDSGKEKCVAVYKLSNGLLVINDEKGFESMILSDQIKSGNQMGEPAK